MNLKRGYRRAKRWVVKNGPTIATGGAIVGVGTTVYFSFKAGLKLYPKIKDFQVSMDWLRANKDSFEDKKEYNKLVANKYKNVGLEFVKALWPAAVSGGATTALIISSHNALQKRYLGAAAAYSSISAALMEYRARVAEKVGKDAELELLTGTQTTEIVEVVTDKKGNEKTKVTKVKEPTVTVNPDVILFDETSPYWRKGNPEMNLLFIRSLEKNFTMELKGKDRVILNEVHEAFGLPETAEGQIVGWVYDETDPNCDCVVDFGIDENSQNFKDFMSGKNEFIYLTLNHDGIIFERFPQLIANRIGDHARCL